MSATVVAKPKKETKSARFELKAEPSWIEKVIETAEALGMDTSNYIRLCVSERMVDDRRKQGLGSED